MFVYERSVKFEDVDAARIVFFARFFTYAHEAMEALLGGLDGGYVRLINERHIGMPAVHVTCDFHSPLRFGDRMRIETTAPRVGTKSVTYRYQIFRVSGDAGDKTHVATIEHVCAVTDLDAMKAIPIPDDVRELLEKNK